MLGPCASVLSLFLLASIPHFYWVPIPTRNTDNLPAEKHNFPFHISHAPGSFFAAAPFMLAKSPISNLTWINSDPHFVRRNANVNSIPWTLNTGAFQICRSNLFQRGFGGMGLPPWIAWSPPNYLATSLGSVFLETLHRTAAAAVAAPGCLTNGLSGRIYLYEREENGVSPRGKKHHDLDTMFTMHCLSCFYF